ncbi:hypothetical protein [Sporosarcina cyprini]|uniref:hypothetical protein n=1 Tax=Sporosarcina cyprini TaxID=2910523 RepID=UPI001EDF216D|nr:hypothetical protein [Sporosarcina cyprini]MCG3088934.1 hypothetical protein [Sporosarcina cyprini]
MMFVKVYQYHVQKGKEDVFITIQGKVTEIYKRYLDFDSIYLNSKEDTTKWMEIVKCRDENEYNQGLAIINEQKEIQDLFKEFTSILCDQSEIREESFMERYSFESLHSN